MAGRRNRTAVLVHEEDENLVEELKKRINDLATQDDSTKCEGLIRELHKRVLAVKKPEAKDQLLTELKTVSSCGLSEDLREKITKSGLGLEGLDLVLKYRTTTTELAQYLFASSDEDVKNDGLEVLKRRLGPSLEVLGGLTSKGIDVNKEWAKRLIEEVPSLQILARISISDLTRLCQQEGEGGASPGEMDVVRKLIKVAESRTRKASAIEEERDQRKKGEKPIDEEKLEKARALMNEAKAETKKGKDEAKTAVKEKMDEVARILKLPSDWSKQENEKKPEELFEHLDSIIEKFDIVEVGESYKSDFEVVEKASGGRALCAIYYSKIEPTRTAERPLITMPAKVKLCSPNNSQQIRYLKFSERRAAAKYVQTVKSSSTNIGYSVGGFASLFVGNVSGGYGSSQEEGNVSSKKANINSASVLQYIWIAKKTFKLGREQMRLSMSARKMAMSIISAGKDLEKRQEAARSFMGRYGSHFPAGLHTLGGVLFNTVDAESSDEKDTYELTSKATDYLHNQVSVGFLGGSFGIGASVSTDHSNSKGKIEATHQEADKTSYTFDVQSMGPAATNPATFSKLLANNSTWALIDRGSHHAYIPVWELIRDLGSGYEDVAKILEDTWCQDEKRKKREGQTLEYKLQGIIEDDLARKKAECIKKVGFPPPLLILSN